MMLNSSHSDDLINQNLLDFRATDYANNCCNTFPNFWLLKKVANRVTGKAIISYGRGDVLKMMIYRKVIFQEMLYIHTFVNNIYNISWLCCRGWDILMKHTGQTILSYNNEVVRFADKIKHEYVIQVIGNTPHFQFNALAKLIKDINVWHGCITHLRYQNFIWLKIYTLGINKVLSTALEDICGQCVISRQ